MAYAMNKTAEIDVMEIFEHLHLHPEISWKEKQTTAYIKRLCEEFGLRTQTFADCTGVVAEIGSGFPVVAVRSDMDALWQEVDGTFRANHSCGHDAHMTMVIGVMQHMAQLESDGRLPHGTIRFIFQPAEEKGTGALKMMEKGVLDGVQFLFGVHVRPKQETEDGRAASAILHGASQTVEGIIFGNDAHAAKPHLGINAIEVASMLVHELAYIHIDPMIPHSVKMTKLQAGGSSANIIPGQASFSLDVRAQTNEVMAALIKRVKTAVDSVSDFYKVPIEIRINHGVVAAKLNHEAEQIMAAAITDVLGVQNLDQPLVTTGGEDFHHYALKYPNVKATMLGLGCGLTPGLHDPKMTFNRRAIYSGIKILSEAALKALKA